METNLSRVIDLLPGMVWTALPDGSADFVNKRWCEFTGLSVDDASGRGWLNAVHPDDLPGVEVAWTRAVETVQPYDIEHRIRSADGAYRWFRVNALPLFDAGGRVAQWCCLETDVDDRKRAEALFAGEKKLLEMVAQGSPLQDILEALCSLVEGLASGSLCSILSIDPDGKRFRHGAGPSLPPSYNELLDGLVMDYKFGPCGMAANWKTQVIAADVATDARWRDSPWPSLVMGHGLRACWSTPILSGDNRVIGVFALYQREAASPTPLELDLTRQFTHIASIAIERAHNDASLKQSEARKSAILNSALDCIVTIDQDALITEFNPAAEATFGYRRGQVLGRPLAEVMIPPSLRARHQRGFARYLASAEARVIGRRVELTAMRADGSEFPVELAITRNPIEGPPSFTGYLRDITERRRAEADLQRSDAFLAEAQRLSSTGSFWWGVATGDITGSEQVFRMFGLDPSRKITLELIRSRIYPDDLAQMQDMVQRAEQGVSDFSYEHRLQLADGSIKHVRLIAHRSRDQQGQIEYIGAVQDVTERRLSEAALGKVRSELAEMTRITSLGALTASIAHEVNQPLSGIITNASTCLKMLAADPPNVAGAQETARRTVRDGNRAADVIRRLRALFTNREAPQEPVDLSDAAREVIALSSSDLQRGRVVVQADLAEELPPVTGDRVQLQQVVLNLLLNAADAMSAVDDRARCVVIRTERDGGDRVRLTVQDVGVGLEPHSAERLFQAFYTTKTEGMGIGLSISRSIIENHGGRLWAEPNVGPGATFSFSVPCHFEEPADSLGPQQTGQSAAAASQPILVKR